MPSLRKRALHPEIELNPETAAARGIKNGDWVEVRTPAGGMRARARFSLKLDPRVVVGEHGWWQGCDELGAGDADPFSPNGTNFNLTVDTTIRDRVSGTPSHRSNLCEIQLVPGFRAGQMHEKDDSDFFGCVIAGLAGTFGRAAFAGIASDVMPTMPPQRSR